jgi:hypothetical protein
MKNVVKKILRLDDKTGVSSLDDLVYVGSKAHGYWIPDHFLNERSICYCVGAGTDISFDMELKTKFSSAVFIFDPTAAAHDHFLLLKDLCTRREQLPELSQPNGYKYRYTITPDQLNEIHFIVRGVASPQSVPAALPADSIQHFMKEFGHSSLDLLKIKTAGNECTIISSIVNDAIDVKIIVVEFDWKSSAGVAQLFKIRKSCSQLKAAGYVLVHSTNDLTRTFIRKDMYTRLFF